MTLDDCELATVFHERPHVARTPHTCTCCGGVIQSGAAYLSHFSVCDGRPASERLCFRCWWLREDYCAHSDENFTPNPSFTLECLRGEADMMGHWPGRPRLWPWWIRGLRLLERELRERQR